MTSIFDELIYAHLLSQFTQRCTTHQLRTGIGQKALALALKMAEHDVAHNSVEDGIAQKLETFVVLRTALFVLPSYTFMQQSLLIKTDVMRIEAQNVVKG